MSGFKELSDGELNELLKARLLASDDTDTNKLVDMQASVVFAKEAVVVPTPVKEKALFSKLGVKAAGKFSTGWIFTSLSVAAAITITTVVLIVNSNASEKRSQDTKQVYSKPVSQTNVVSLNTAKFAATESRTEDASPEKPLLVAARSTGTKSVSPALVGRELAPVATTKTITPAASVNAVTISETKTATPSISTSKAAETKPAIKSIKPREGSSCRIWKTKDVCAPPDSLKFPYGIDCDACEYSYSCKEINKKELTAVILRIYKRSGFILKNGFHSIKLTRADGKKIEPFAISVDRYMNNVKKLGVNFKNVVDMILLFPEAAPGDKISIEGLVEAVIEE